MHPDVREEQAYFDHALEQRERARSQLDRAPEATTDPAAAAELRARLGSIGLADPDEGVAFGRIDRRGQRTYVGKNAIWDDDNELLVINWQAPAASSFYTATPEDPQGLDARRTYRCESNRILDIDEVVFSGVAANGTGEPSLDDALLESLSRGRSGELSDIVTTIQGAQYDVVSRPVEQLLVVQGGPGTGKTVVGLHRASWLLYNMSDRLQSEDVLVVGPNPAFVRYIRAVLPRLGDEAVVQRSVTELGPRVRSGRVEPPVIRRLKGDRRMIELIVRGLRNRQRVASDQGPVELTIDNRRVTLDPALIAARASQLERRPHNEAHQGLRDFVIQEVQSYLGRRGVLDSAALEASTRGASGRDIDKYLERAWPHLTPQAFLLDLLSTRSRLEAAADGILDEHEVTLLSVSRDAKVGSYEWSLDDIPLLDAADFLLNGPQRMYEYIVLDEAQDLSPMQLLSIARRSRNGWMTVLGDLAQATSPAALGSWNEVADHLYRPDVPANLAELRLGYRLPTEVHEVAMRLLREIAPGLATPEAVRPSGHEVIVDRAEPGELAPAVVSRIRSLLGTGLIGVITPDGIRGEITAALDAEGLFWAPELQAATAPIVVLAAEKAKGLEFDNVVVIEPNGIVADHGDNGLRALFVAVTRCTQRLAIVHAEPLPAVLALRGRPVGAPTPAVAPLPEPADAPPEPAYASATTTNGMPGRPVLPSPAVASSTLRTANGNGHLETAPGAEVPPAPVTAASTSPAPVAPAAAAPPGAPASAPPPGGPTPGGRRRSAEPLAVPGPPAPPGPLPGRPGAGTGRERSGTAGPAADAAARAPSGPAADRQVEPPTRAPWAPREPAEQPAPLAGPMPVPRPEPAPAPGVPLVSPSGAPAVTNAPIGTAAHSWRTPDRPQAGDLEQQVASTVTTAIATSLATTLRRLVQPALLPDIVEELGRLVAGPERDPSTGGEPVAVELPATLVERATQAVAAGQATSVSAYIADALEDRNKLAAVSGMVNRMLSDTGGPLADADDDAHRGAP